MIDKRMQPRWLAKLAANLGGYFWLPCPICKEPFGGQEWGSGCLYTAEGKGTGVCQNCEEEAERRNQQSGFNTRYTVVS